MTSDRSQQPKLTIDDDPHFAEQFPLSPIDDFMIHQTTDPIRVMMTSDPRAYERYWMVCHDDGGLSRKNILIKPVRNKKARELRASV